MARKKMGKGWYNEPLRHSLARKGVRTGSKNKAVYPRLPKEKQKVLKSEAKKTEEFIRKTDIEIRRDKEKVTLKNRVNYIMAYEDGSLNDEQTLQLFSYLIRTGMAWQLQGSIYGRPAKQLIDSGLIDRQGRINWKKYDKLKGENR
jgi:hypothetical protein